MMDGVLLSICVLLCCVNLIYNATKRCDPSISCGCLALTTIVTSRIVDGEAAPNYARGWIVSLQQSGQHICGASLLTSEYAVTVAQCLEGVMDNISILSIVAGTNVLNNTSITTIQQRSIINVTIHPNYDSSTIINDIAILKFSPLTISLNSKIAFICLSIPDEDPFQTNTDLVAIGWGYLFEYIYIVSNTLRQVTVQAISSTSFECQQSGLTNSLMQFCAETIAGGKDTCKGDSGGPLMVFVDNRWVLAGITSSGKECARKGYPGIYTRVSYFISFINSNVNFLMTETTMVPVTETITVPIRQTTTVSLATSTIEHNNNQSSITENMINKSIMIVILCFSFLACFLFSY